MAEVIRMPLLSDTMTEGKIVKWNKSVGDQVKSDDVLADVETDKATMEVVGYADGTLLYVGIKEGEAAKSPLLGSQVKTFRACWEAHPLLLQHPLPPAHLHLLQ
jgi:hypothetical protein